jgi:hypothetical protein
VARRATICNISALACGSERALRHMRRRGCRSRRIVGFRCSIAGRVKGADACGGYLTPMTKPTTATDCTASIPILAAWMLGAKSKAAVFQAIPLPTSRRGDSNPGPHHYEEFSASPVKRMVEPDHLPGSGSVCHACATVRRMGDLERELSTRVAARLARYWDLAPMNDRQGFRLVLGDGRGGRARVLDAVLSGAARARRRLV